MTRWSAGLTEAQIAQMSANNRAKRIPGRDQSDTEVAKPAQERSQSDPGKEYGHSRRTGKLSRTRISESAEQQAVIFWWDTIAAKQHGLDARHLIAVPNGGARNPITGAILKAEGTRPGVPDLLLAVPHGPSHGLFVEMKAIGGKAEPHQRDYHALLRAQCYAVKVCQGFDDASRTIEAYLRGAVI